MKNWLKGLILLVAGNILYEVIPKWITDFLLSQPNPLYSLGELLNSLPSIQDILAGDLGRNGAFITGILGLLMIFYGLYIFVKDLYKRS